MNLQTGIDALAFTYSLNGGWDTIVWDPPYHEEGSSLDRNTTPSNKGANNLAYRLSIQKDKIIMPRKKRDEILNLIKSKMDIPGCIIYFGPEEVNGWKHIWNKGDAYASGGYVIRNSESIIIHPVGEFKPKRLPGLHHIISVLPESTIIRLRGNKYVRSNVPRLCAKPHELFMKLYKHCNSKHILDPFAGFGRSISAAFEMGLKIDACDIDSELDWSKYSNYKPLEAYF